MRSTLSLERSYFPKSKFRTTMQLRLKIRKCVAYHQAKEARQAIVLNISSSTREVADAIPHLHVATPPRANSTLHLEPQPKHQENLSTIRNLVAAIREGPPFGSQKCLVIPPRGPLIPSYTWERTSLMNGKDSRLFVLYLGMMP